MPDNSGGALPIQVPISEAAGIRIGSSQVTVAAKILDTLVVVLAPLLIPACILALIRTGHDRAIGSGFTLVDIACGGVAVALAALARSLAGDGDKWKILACVGALVMIIETSLAIRGDNLASTDNLVADVSQCQETCDVAQLRQLAVAIQEGAPPSLHWVVALLTGLLLCAVALLVIWKEA